MHPPPPPPPPLPPQRYGYDNSLQLCDEMLQRVNFDHAPDQVGVCVGGVNRMGRGTWRPGRAQGDVYAMLLGRHGAPTHTVTVWTHPLARPRAAADSAGGGADAGGAPIL